MANKGHVITVGADTRAFETNVRKGVTEPVEDAEKALHDLAGVDAASDLITDLDKAGDKADDLGTSRGPGQLEQELKDAQRATKDLGDEARDTKRNVANIGDDSKASFRKLSDNGEEAGRELRQNFGETVSTFRGDLADVPQLVQDTFGGLAAGLGPAGAVGAGIVAAGIGVGTALVQNWQADIEKMQEAAGEWADKYIEAGSRVLDFEQIASGVRDILTDPEKYKAASKAAEEWGVDVTTAVEAQAGMPSAIDKVKASVDGMKYSMDAGKASGKGMYDEFGNLNGQALETEKKYRTAKGSLDELTGAMDMGAQQAQVWSDHLRYVAEHTEDATRKTDEFGDSVVTLPGGKKIYIDAETGQATDNVDDIQNKVFRLKGKTLPIDADTAPVYAKLRDLQNNLHPLRVNLDATVTYRTKDGRLIQ